MDIRKIVKKWIPNAAYIKLRMARKSVFLIPYRMRSVIARRGFRKKIAQAAQSENFREVEWSFFNEDDPQVNFLQEGIGYIRKNVSGVSGRSATDEISGDLPNSLKFRGLAATNDEWLVAVADLAKVELTAYRVEFSFRKNTPFRELQFAFNYRGLGSRLRFRFEDDQVFFERIRKFVFEHEIDIMNCSLELKKWHHISIDIFGLYSRISIDGALLMESTDFGALEPGGNFAVIAWETNSSTEINLDMKDFQFKAIGENLKF